MPKFTVYFMSPYCSWEHIEAETREAAIEQCDIPEEYDMNEPGAFMAAEESPEDEGEDTPKEEEEDA